MVSFSSLCLKNLQNFLKRHVSFGFSTDGQLLAHHSIGFPGLSTVPKVERLLGISQHHHDVFVYEKQYNDVLFLHLRLINVSCQWLIIRPYMHGDTHFS